MIAVRDFLKAVIGAWEGGYSADPDDPGNWAGGQLLGSMRGVTPAALAAHRQVPVGTLTVDDMKAVTLAEAAEIGLVHYYNGPHFNLLTWGPATAALLDFAWGAGPRQAVLSMQRLVGVADDGILGPATAKAYNDWVAAQGWDAATQAVHDMRADFYRMIAQRNESLRKYLRGWLNRDDWASAANPQWRAQWAA